MKVIHGLDDERSVVGRSVLTVGNFDGVHRGHQRIIAVAREEARGQSLPVVALTFEPHPLSVVNPRLALQRLSSPAQKLAHLHEAGIDVAVVAQSTPAFLSITPELFIREIIVARFHPAYIVEGWNFGFGRGREGSVDTLQQFAVEFDYQVHIVEPVTQRLEDGSKERVSSSLIRRLLLEGQVELAGGALGRPYSLTGTVVEGAKRGQPLGFPTANLEVADQLVPGDGVYAGRTLVGDREYRSALSIGQTPTFDGQIRRVEAHLIGFNGDLYGRTIEVHFRRRLRGQQKFGSREELARQIESDVENIRREPE